MRVLTNALVCLIVLTAVHVFGQETFSPLIKDNTVAFVHVDLRKVEIDLFRTQAEKIGGEFLKQLNFDEKSFKATTRELNTELDKLDALIRPPYETITKKLGIRELALIADLDLIEFGVPAILAAPWKGKTEDDLKTLTVLFGDILEGGVNIPFVTFNDFLLLPLSDSPEVAKLAIAAWSQSTVKDPLISQALQTLGQDEIKIAAALPEKLKTMIAAAALPNDIPREIQGLLAFAAQKIEWAAASLPINALFSNEKTDATLLTVKTIKRSDAVQLRGLLENAIEFGINTARFAAEQERNDNFQVPPFFFEFAKGLLRALLPDVENDRLIFRLKGEGVAAKQGIIATGGIAIALLLPAVQAAREAARRMQCSNNLKQIVIGLHNYHDTYMMLPPLYTVDKDGKPLHTWRVLILPFIEQPVLYQKIRLDEPWDSEYNKQFHNAVIDVYRCPSSPDTQKPGSCCYSVIAGKAFVPAKKAGVKTGNSFAKITDGTSNTLAVVEVKQPFCWMDPTADITLTELVKGINKKDGKVGSFHPNGINAALFDGSERFLSNDISDAILKALGTCAGGENP